MEPVAAARHRDVGPAMTTVGRCVSHTHTPIFIVLLLRSSWPVPAVVVSPSVHAPPGMPSKLMMVGVVGDVDLSVCEKETKVAVDSTVSGVDANEREEEEGKKK